MSASISSTDAPAGSPRASSLVEPTAISSPSRSEWARRSRAWLSVVPFEEPGVLDEEHAAGPAGDPRMAPRQAPVAAERPRLAVAAPDQSS